MPEDDQLKQSLQTFIKQSAGHHVEIVNRSPDRADCRAPAQTRSRGAQACPFDCLQCSIHQSTGDYAFHEHCTHCRNIFAAGHFKIICFINGDDWVCSLGEVNYLTEALDGLGITGRAERLEEALVKLAFEISHNQDRLGAFRNPEAPYTEATFSSLIDHCANCDSYYVPQLEPCHCSKA